MTTYQFDYLIGLKSEVASLQERNDELCQLVKFQS